MILGHAIEKDTEEPPRGLQFLLKTDVGGIVSDTITMANLGYLQLKANPGVYDMVIRPGRGRELYEFNSMTDSSSSYGSLIGDYGAKVVVDSFIGATVYPVVNKRPGMEDEKLIENTESEKEDPGFWESVKSK
jgi:UDP-glucose:glycoprotein glucosyltransferase